VLADTFQYLPGVVFKDKAATSVNLKSKIMEVAKRTRLDTAGKEETVPASKERG